MRRVGVKRLEVVKLRNRPESQTSRMIRVFRTNAIRELSS
jgi:hypothetical protein